MEHIEQDIQHVSHLPRESSVSLTAVLAQQLILCERSHQTGQASIPVNEEFGCERASDDRLWLFACSNFRLKWCIFIEATVLHKATAGMGWLLEFLFIP